MPRHQDNVDVIITSNPRPSRFFSGVYSLEVSPMTTERPTSAAWWSLDFQDSALRIFTDRNALGQAYVHAMVTTPDAVAVSNIEPWGQLQYMQATPPSASKFTWGSTQGHEVTLELGAWIDGGQALDVVCTDTNPSNAIWTFELRLSGTTYGAYIVDYSKTQSEPKTPGVATFAVHQPYR